MLKSEALNISYYLINLSGKKGISNLKLQNMLYFIQKEYLNKFGEPAFLEEIEAWKFGPAVPSIYYQFAGYGSLPIMTNEVLTNNIFLDKKLKQLIKKVFNKRKKQKVYQMVTEIKKDGGAWQQTFNNGLGYGDTIDIQYIMNDIKAEK